MDYSALTDEQVVAHLRDGDQGAMSVLYDRYGRLVFSLAFRILNDRAAAEESVQEVFVKVWKRSREFDSERGKFSSWLTGIAHNQAIDELRRRRVRPSSSADGSESMDVVDEGPAPIELALRSLEHGRIIQALNQIPADQRHAIELAYFESYTQQEISTRLKEPLGTIKTRMRLGMQKLRTLLDEPAS